MSGRILVAGFPDEQSLVRAVARAEADGLAIRDAITPYPVPALARLGGPAPPAIARACLAGGALGGASALAFQAWTTMASWPLDVGGKPLAAWLAWMPVTFELAVLLAAFGAAGAFVATREAARASTAGPTAGEIGPAGFALAIGVPTEAELARAREACRLAGASAFALREEP